MKFRIKSALGGGFGGIKNQDWVIIDAPSLDAAMNEARESAVQEYQSMEGMHGLRGVADIMEEDGLDQGEAEEVYQEEMDSWLDYTAEPCSQDHKDSDA